MTARTFRFPVQSQSANVPTWFAQQSENTWVKFDASPMRDIDYLPASVLGYGTRPNGDVYSYSGGCVHPYRDSLLIWGTGHPPDDNGVYEFSLTDADSMAGTPKWKPYTIRDQQIWPVRYRDRIWKPAEGVTNPLLFDYTELTERHAIPGEDTGTVYPNAGTGGPVGYHSYGMPVWEGENDALWIVNQNGCGEPYNKPTTGMDTFSRSSVWRCKHSSKLTQVPGGPSPWELLSTHSQTLARPNGEDMAEGPTIYNPIKKEILVIGIRGFYAINLTTGVPTWARQWPSPDAASWGTAQCASAAYRTRGGETVVDHPFAGYFNSSGSFSPAEQRGPFALIDLNDYNNPLTMRTRPVNWPSSWNKLVQGSLVWHGPSDAFLIYGVDATGYSKSTIWKLYQPQGNYWGGTWEVAPITNGATFFDAQNYYSAYHVYGRFNIIRNVGGGAHDALVFAMKAQLDGTTYVYKLPVGGV